MMATGMSDSFRRTLEQHALTDPGDRMRLELHTAPVEQPTVELSGPWASGGFVAPFAFDDDTVGPVVASEGYVELTIEVNDWLSPRLAVMAQMFDSMNAVSSSFAGLRRAVSDFSLGPWPPFVAPNPAVDVLYPAVTPQPWARHDRERTSLELAIEQWQRENSPPAPPSFTFRLPAFERGEAASRDTIDCSSSNGARWSDLMSRIDELTEET